jgi:hypothetical protein
MKTSELLIKARARIASPQNWCKEALWQNHGAGNEATCLIGALIMESNHKSIYPPTHPHESPTAYAACVALAAVFPQDYPPKERGLTMLPHFNDTHTHDDVIALFDRAIARSLQVEALAHVATPEPAQAIVATTAMELAQ